MYKQDLALYNLQRLLYHKTQSNQTKPNQTNPEYLVYYWFVF